MKFGVISMKKSALDRFYEKVEQVTESGCWIWTGSLNDKGYGQFHDYDVSFATHRGNVSAHRWSFNFFKGPLMEGAHVCHSCDVPCCVNPDHLWIGTHQDNMRDLWTKGRGTKGRVFPERSKAFCIHNHPYTPENTVYAGAKRMKRCRICAARRKRESYIKHRDSILARQNERRKARIANLQHILSDQQQSQTHQTTSADA